MDLQDIKEKFRCGNYEISFHAEKERYAEDISLADIEMAIACGYTSIQSLRVITVYLPKLPKWIDERTRRKTGESNA